MIKNKNRSYYIGASDTGCVMMNWNTKTFKKWWLVKLGFDENNFQNKYTLAGTNYEHKIIDALNIPNIEKDNQVIVLGRLRVNLDANTKEEIHEIKTYNWENGFDINSHIDYQHQVQVQMFATGIHKAYINAYGLLEEEYKNFFEDIDYNRLSSYEIKYDEQWVNQKYLPRILILIKCLEESRFPTKKEIELVMKEVK